MASSESRSTRETDPVTGKARLLRQTFPDEAAAHAALSRMLVEAGGAGSPTKYLEGTDLEVSFERYRSPSWNGSWNECRRFA